MMVTVSLLHPIRTILSRQRRLGANPAVVYTGCIGLDPDLRRDDGLGDHWFGDAGYCLPLGAGQSLDHP